MRHSIGSGAKRFLWNSVPVEGRKRALGLLGGSRLVPQDLRLRLSLVLLGDLAHTNNAQFHKFLWSNHLGYASFYEVDRFEVPIESSRGLFFDDLKAVLQDIEVETGQAVRSVLDVGCSIGHNLRELETGLLSGADVLHGLDLDANAVSEGNRHLSSVGSRIRLYAGDVESMEEALGDQAYDLIFCSGLLLYLEQDPAEKVVAAMLRRARLAVAFAALAHPDVDNRVMTRSTVREWDRSHVHNVDAMVQAGGGAVVGRRYQREKLDFRQTVYFVFARPAGHPTADGGSSGEAGRDSEGDRTELQFKGA